MEITKTKQQLQEQQLIEFAYTYFETKIVKTKKYFVVNCLYDGKNFIYKEFEALHDAIKATREAYFLFTLHMALHKTKTQDIK